MNNNGHIKKTALNDANASLEVNRKIPRSLYTWGYIIMGVLAIAVGAVLMNIRCTDYAYIRAATIARSEDNNANNIMLLTREQISETFNGMPVDIILPAAGGKETVIAADLQTIRRQENNTAITIVPRENNTSLLLLKQPAECSLRITTKRQTVFKKIFGKFY